VSDFPPDISFALFHDGVFNDITPDVRLTADHIIQRGRPDEASSADPSSLTLLLNNGRSHVNPAVSGRYSPKNPRSDLFGKIGKNTPIRLQVGAPVPEVVDTFTRNVSGGWGTADTGQTWATTGAAADFAVGNGYGSAAQPATGIAHLTLLPAPSADVDVSVDVATDQLATGASLFGGPLLRAVNNADFYMTRVDFTTSAGIVLTLRKRVANVESQLATFTTTLTHTAETFYRVRFQANGTTLRARIWAATDTEPSAWHVEAIDEDLTAAANVGTRSFSNTGNTNTDPELRFDNVEAITVTEPAPTVVDTFDRTESDGWGTADTGQDWVIYDPFGQSPAAADFSVSDGAGHMEMQSASPTPGDIRMIRADGVDLADVEATFTVATDQRSLSTNALRATFGGFLARVDPVVDTFVLFALWFAADSGQAEGQGLRVATSIVTVVEGEQSDEVQGQIIPDLLYEPGVPLRVRVQCAGPEMRMRVWADGQQEPVVWHAQVHTDLVPLSGQIACYAQVNAEGTTLPVTVSFSDLSVREPTGADDSIRTAVEVSDWPARWDISDSDVWVPVQASGILRRLNHGSPPVRSFLRRHLPDRAAIGHWAFEERGLVGTRSVPAVVGGQALRVGGFKFGEDDDVPGSEALPVLLESTGAGTAQFGDAPFMRGFGSVPAVGTGSWSVLMLMRLPTDDFPEGTAEQQLLRFFTTGTASEWIISAATVTDNPQLRLRVFDSDGVQLGTEIASQQFALDNGLAPLLDDWRVLRIRALQDGANVDWRFDWFTLDGGSSHGNGNTFAGTVGQFRRISTTFGQDLAGMRMGHLSAWGYAFPAGYFDLLTGLHGALGFAGEGARGRVQRLLSEEGIPGLLTGEAATAVGPQLPGSLEQLVREAAEADLAVLGEQQEAVALNLRARETLYNQDPVLVLDYANGQITPPFDPQDDDQRTANQITVARQSGSDATAVQETGPLNVQNPEQDPDGVGRYASSRTVNVASDDQLLDIAGWLLHLGTVDELRYPRVTLNLGNERMRDLIEDVMRIREGDLIRIINPPDWLPADDIDLIVEGYEERLNAFRWEVTLVCSPASPWTIAHATQTDTLLSDDFEDAERSIVITDGGDAAWLRTDAEARFGTWSLRSGVILDDQTSDAIVEVPDQAVSLRFWYKVDSEADFDFFRVLVGDDEVLTVSGDVDWQLSDEFDVTSATEVTFRYEKDAAVSEGADAAFIDDVEFVMVVSGPDLPDRADTVRSELVYDIDADDVQLVVHTPQEPDRFVAEWIGAAVPISQNGDFEEDLSGWVGNGASIERVLTPNGTQQFGGQWSLQITPDGVTEFPNAGSDMVPVAEGRTYVLNGWLRCATTRRVSLNLNWFDGAFNFLSVSTNDKTIQAEVWTWFEVTDEAPAGAENANLAPTVPDFPPSADVLTADEVWLRPVEDWSEPQEVPFDVRLSPRGGSSGEVVRVASVEPLAWDVFARTETDTWGTSDSGHTWQEVGGAASDRSVDDGSGVITLQASPSTVRTQHVTEDVEDCEVLVRMWVDQVATGASLLPSVLLRRSAISDYYRARVHFGTSGDMFTSVARGTTQIGSAVTLPWTYSADDEFWVRARLIGHRVLVRVWPVDRLEPVTVWHNDQTVTTEGTIDSGAIGVAGSSFGGNTNVNPELHYADYELVTPQEMTVERGINHVQIDHAAGTDVRLAQPPTAAL
jgi:hypothetical protein